MNYQKKKIAIIFIFKKKGQKKIDTTGHISTDCVFDNNI